MPLLSMNFLRQGCFPILTPMSQPLQPLYKTVCTWDWELLKARDWTLPTFMCLIPDPGSDAQQTLREHHVREQCVHHCRPDLVPLDHRSVNYTNDHSPLLPRISIKPVGSEVRVCGSKSLLFYFLVWLQISHLTDPCVSVLVCEMRIRIGPTAS